MTPELLKHFQSLETCQGIMLGLLGFLVIVQFINDRKP